MDPLTIGVLSRERASPAWARAGWAGLKAWNGWLELKKLELAQTAGDRAFRPRAAGSRSPTFANASASSRRSPPASISKRHSPQRASLPKSAL